MPRRVRTTPSLFAPAEQFFRRMTDDKARWRRRVATLGFIAALLFLGYSLMSDTYGVPRIVKLELEKRVLVQANNRQTALLMDAVRQRDLLKHDPAYIEQIARAEYHMFYPNETIYRFRER